MRHPAYWFGPHGSAHGQALDDGTTPQPAAPFAGPMRHDRRALLAAAALATVSAATGASAAPIAASDGPAPPARPAALPPVAGVRLDPRAFGALGDGTTKDTAAFQEALDRAAVMGGG